MCTESSGPQHITAAIPRTADGHAVDPIPLEPVDEIVITTLVDNVYDALLPGDDRVTRSPFRAGTAQAPQFESGSTTVGLMAEHGFSAGSPYDAGPRSRRCFSIRACPPTPWSPTPTGSALTCLGYKQ